MLRRSTMPSAVVLAGLAAAVLAAPAGAEGYAEAVKATTLLQTSTWGDGVPLAYPAGTPKVTTLLVEIPPGADTGRHRHPVPLIAYVLEGSVLVEADGQPPQVIHAGQAISETSGWHIGRNTGTTPVKILGVFIGAEGTANTVKE